MSAALWPTVLTALALGGAPNGVATPGSSESPPPNIVLILADDHGYADWGPPAGERGFDTPNINRLAADGVTLTSFYAQPTCSPTRASILTGSYPNRVGLQIPLLPAVTREALHPDEITIAEILHDVGYATALFGKWHLGDQVDFLPLRQGFDEYFGLPYSNDAGPGGLLGDDVPPLPLYDGETVVEENPDQAELTRRYTERAVDFIERNRGRRFFLFLSHTMPHVPLAVSEQFAGTTDSLYGEVVVEIDWSVGEVLDAVQRTGIDDRTLVIFLSDNSPWLLYGDHAGSASPLYGGKGTAFEGGVRVPFVARWPGRIRPGSVTDEMASTNDLLPTLAHLAGGDVPTDRVIDGRDIWPLVSDENATSPHDVLYMYVGFELNAVRRDRWKLHLPHAYFDVVTPGHGGDMGELRLERIPLSLFDLHNDIGETTDVGAQHPDVVAGLLDHAELARHLLGDSLTGAVGQDLRQPGIQEPSTSVP